MSLGVSFNEIKKETPTKVFSCAYCEILKITHFEEHLRMGTIVGFSSNNVYIYILSILQSSAVKHF